jgi:death-on-curing protein
MTQYLSIEDALFQIKRLGFYVKDIGLLESALARPQTSLFGEDAYPELSLKTAALMQSIMKNHALVDGNKRTSWVLMVSFFWINGFSHDMDDQVGFDLSLGMATDELTLEQASEIIQNHLRKL